MCSFGENQESFPVVFADPVSHQMKQSGGLVTPDLVRLALTKLERENEREKGLNTQAMITVADLIPVHPVQEGWTCLAGRRGIETGTFFQDGASTPGVALLLLAMLMTNAPLATLTTNAPLAILTTNSPLAIQMTRWFHQCWRIGMIVSNPLVWIVMTVFDQEMHMTSPSHRRVRVPCLGLYLSLPCMRMHALLTLSQVHESSQSTADTRVQNGVNI